MRTYKITFVNKPDRCSKTVIASNYVCGDVDKFVHFFDKKGTVFSLRTDEIFSIEVVAMEEPQL